MLFLGFFKLGGLLLDRSVAVTGFLAEFFVVKLASLMPVLKALDLLVQLLLLAFPKLFGNLAVLDICRQAFDGGL